MRKKEVAPILLITVVMDVIGNPHQREVALIPGSVPIINPKLISFGLHNFHVAYVLPDREDLKVPCFICDSSAYKIMIKNELILFKGSHELSTQ